MYKPSFKNYLVSLRTKGAHNIVVTSHDFPVQRSDQTNKPLILHRWASAPFMNCLAAIHSQPFQKHLPTQHVQQLNFFALLLRFRVLLTLCMSTCASCACLSAELLARGSGWQPGAVWAISMAPACLRASVREVMNRLFIR